MNKFEKLIELIVNEDNKQAQKLFHEIVVEKSRTIYESLLEDEDSDEVEEMEDDVDADEEGVKEGLDVTVEEAKQLLDHIDGTLNESDAGDLLQRVAEHFGVEVEGLVPVLESHGDALLEMAYGESDDEDDGELDGDDEGDDLEGDDEMHDFDDDGELDDHEADHEYHDEESEEIEDRVVDLEDAIDELKAEFDAMIGDDGMEDDFGGEEEFGMEPEMDDVEDFGADVIGGEDDMEESLVREYVEKVTPKVTTQEEDSPNTKSTVAGKNDMGGTTANILGDQSEEAGGKASGPKDVDSRANSWKNTGGKGTKNSKTEKATKPTNKTDSEKSILDKPQGK